MSLCIVPPVDALVIRLTLVGTGGGLLRMEKRLNCAAAGLGIRLMLEIRKDIEALGISHAKTPVVLHGGKTIFSGLPRTEEIEAWLKKNI